MNKVCVGKVVKLHGYLGQMKIRTQFDKDFKLNSLATMFDDKDNEYLVEKVFKVKDGIVVKLAGVDLAKSNTFIGKDLYIDRVLVQDKILIEDLKNSLVIFEDGEEIGAIIDVNDYGSAEVFSIKNKAGKEIMFPNVKGLIVKFVLEEKKLIVSKERFKEVADEN